MEIEQLLNGYMSIWIDGAENRCIEGLREGRMYKWMNERMEWESVGRWRE